MNGKLGKAGNSPDRTGCSPLVGVSGSIQNSVCPKYIDHIRLNKQYLECRTTKIPTNRKTNRKQTASCRPAPLGSGQKQYYPEDARTMNVLREIANSIYKCVQFTVDVPSNYEDKKVPVLDLQLSVKDNQITMSYLRSLLLQSK